MTERKGLATAFGVGRTLEDAREAKWQMKRHSIPVAEIANLTGLTKLEVAQLVRERTERALNACYEMNAIVRAAADDGSAFPVFRDKVQEELYEAVRALNNIWLGLNDEHPPDLGALPIRMARDESDTRKGKLTIDFGGANDR